MDPVLKKVKIYQQDLSDPHSLSRNHIKSLLPDPLFPDRYLWVNTSGGGINRLDLNSEQFIHYDENDGLPNGVIYGALPDKQGHLWLSTNRGLARITLDEKRELTRLQNFDTNDGLPGDEFNTNAFYKNKDGLLFFGGVDGLVFFHPDSLLEKATEPPLAITKMQVNYKTISHKDANTPLRKSITYTDEIVLDYHQNALALEFSALDFSSPSRHRYSYKLEHFDEDWKDAGSNRRAVYTNLDPGNYVFRLRAANSKGEWGEKEKQLVLSIHYPWWRKWWAYVLYGLAAFGLYWFFRRLELSRRKTTAGSGH